MFQNKYFKPNYTRDREIERDTERGQNGGWEWAGDLISQCGPFFGITFLQAKIC